MSIRPPVLSNTPTAMAPSGPCRCGRATLDPAKTLEFAGDSPLEGDGFEPSVPAPGQEVRFALDSLLEETGFELPVPLAIGALCAPKIAREL
jgi:hypothetical protein